MINNMNTATFRYSKYFTSKEIDIKDNNRVVSPANSLFQSSSWGHIPNECKDLANKLDDIRAEIIEGHFVEGDVKSFAKRHGLL
ncbi:MAG: hypothetical protein LBC39_06480 [Methanobrevibacter sp.]|jgi:hypothetical protein|nr:hypothetical protein [Candidatus Methanovirga aequatorialis]